ncbi:MAG: MBL fold metallo-hydrolase [Parvularculaceae bacterium]|nr:MBL fold metallo-hydrolase [Parvularculaceae bacterium]
MRGETEVLFHGVRGSAPTSGLAYAEFGGDTPAIEIRAPDARLFLDAGSGVRNAAAAARQGDIDLVLTHYHYDHLIGLPFFEPAWRQIGRLRVWAPVLEDRRPEDVLGAFFRAPYCPVGLSDFKMAAEILAFRPGDTLDVGGGVAVSTMLGAHPGGCAVLRMKTAAGDIVYASDIEAASAREAARLAMFARGADLLIIDSMNDDMTAPHRRGWGHSSWREAACVGAAAGARSIALFHHDPRADDDRLNRIDAEAQAFEPRAFLARQGSRAVLNSRGGGERRSLERRRATDDGDAANQVLSRRR